MIKKIKAFRTPIVGENYYDKLEAIQKNYNVYPFKPCLDAGICDFYIKFYKDVINSGKPKLSSEDADLLFNHLVEYSTRLPYTTARQISNVMAETIRDANGDYRNHIVMHCIGDIMTQTYFCDPRFGAILNKPIVTNRNPLHETVFKQLDLSDLSKCLTYLQEKSLVAIRKRYGEYHVDLPEYSTRYKKGMLIEPIMASGEEQDDDDDIEMKDSPQKLV